MKHGLPGVRQGQREERRSSDLNKLGGTEGDHGHGWCFFFFLPPIGAVLKKGDRPRLETASCDYAPSFYSLRCMRIGGRWCLCPSLPVGSRLLGKIQPHINTRSHPQTCETAPSDDGDAPPKILLRLPFTVPKKTGRNGPKRTEQITSICRKIERSPSTDVLRDL